MEIKIFKEILTPVLKYKWPKTGLIWIKDESKCPTHTFKDRLGLIVTKDLSFESFPREWLVSSITLGNTALSLAHAFKKQFTLKNRPKILAVFPKDFMSRKIGPDNFGLSESGRDVIERSKRLGVYCVNVDLEERFFTKDDLRKVAEGRKIKFKKHLDVSHGLGKPIYSDMLKEALGQIEEEISFIIVPVGTGVLFDDFVNYIEDHKLNISVIGVSTTKKDSIADKIYSYYSEYFRELLEKGEAHHIRNKRHRILIVKDQHILNVMPIIPKECRSEPSAAAAFCFLGDTEIIPKKSNVLIINTGDGIISR